MHVIYLLFYLTSLKKSHTDITKVARQLKISITFWDLKGLVAYMTLNFIFQIIKILMLDRLTVLKNKNKNTEITFLINKALFGF